MARATDSPRRRSRSSPACSHFSSGEVATSTRESARANPARRPPSPLPHLVVECTGSVAHTARQNRAVSARCTSSSCSTATSVRVSAISTSSKEKRGRRAAPGRHAHLSCGLSQMNKTMGGIDDHLAPVAVPGHLQRGRVLLLEPPLDGCGGAGGGRLQVRGRRRNVTQGPSLWHARAPHCTIPLLTSDIPAKALLNQPQAPPPSAISPSAAVRCAEIVRRYRDRSTLHLDLDRSRAAGGDI